MKRWTKTFSLVGRISLNGSKSGKRGYCGYPGDRLYSSGAAEPIKMSETSSSQPPSQLVRRGGALALFAAFGLVGYNAFDDLVIYDRCSSKAMETASQDPRMKEILGDEIQRGPWHWYGASLAVAHEGQSASCSFPVSGSHGTGSLHLKAVRLNGKMDTFLPRMLDGGQWEILMLEARIPSSDGKDSTPRLQKINLMQTSDELKTGDGIGGPEVNLDREDRKTAKARKLKIHNEELKAGYLSKGTIVFLRDELLKKSITQMREFSQTMSMGEKDCGRLLGLWLVQWLQP